MTAISGLLSIPDGLQNIRDYIDHDGAILSGHQEFITYFALPFVPEPHTHPSFQHLFEVSISNIIMILSGVINSQIICNYIQGNNKQHFLISLNLGCHWEMILEHI